MTDYESRKGGEGLLRLNWEGKNFYKNGNGMTPSVIELELLGNSSFIFSL